MRVLGINDAPNIILGERLRLVTVPNETRLGYEGWWHLEVWNEQRGDMSARVETKPAEHCTAELQFIPTQREREHEIITDAGLFLTGASTAPTEVYTLVAGRSTYIPVYLDNTGPWSSSHPVYRYVKLAADTYVTGARFMHPELAVRQRLPGGEYQLVVKVKHGRQTLIREFPLTVKGEW